MIIEMGNKYYLMWIGIFVFTTLFLGLILRKKSMKTQKRFIMFLLLTNFLLHFLKLLLPEYRDNLPWSIKHSTFENICAVSTLLFPFFFRSQNKYLKDYMFYMGLISGLAAMIYPTEALNNECFDLDTIRFYFCHMSLFITSLYMVLFGFHSLNFKRILVFPLMFLLTEAIILVNEVILMEMGFVNLRNDDFLDINYRNPSLVFGPIKDEEFELINKYGFEWMVPKPFKEVMVGEYKGETKYTPLLWIIVPAYVYFSFFYAVLYLIFGKWFNKKEIN